MLRVSMRLQQSMHNEVRDQFHELRTKRASQRRFRYLNTVYHGSVCPELRLPAETCQFLPAIKAHGARWKGKKNARHTVRLRSSTELSRGPHAEALTVCGHCTTMTAIRARLPPWSPLRFSMKAQCDLCCGVQGSLYYSTGRRNCQAYPS